MQKPGPATLASTSGESRVIGAGPGRSPASVATPCDEKLVRPGAWCSPDDLRPAESFSAALRVAQQVSGAKLVYLARQSSNGLCDAIAPVKEEHEEFVMGSVVLAALHVRL